MIVERIKISAIIIVFVMYLVIHFAIGLYVAHTKKQSEQNLDDKQLQQNLKIGNFFLKWFPAIYVVFLMFWFYNH